MANRSNPRPTRGRAVPKRSIPLMPFYLGLALLLILGATFVLIKSLNPAAETSQNGSADSANIPDRPALTAAVGQTADGFWYKGDPNAPVKVVEYADYECSACATLEADLVRAEFDAKYVETGKVQYIYRELPLVNIHSSAQFTAEVARCAGDQNLFWPVHDALFQTQRQWADQGNARATILSAADQAGANRSTLEACVDSGKHTAAINASAQEAATRQLGGTPTVFVNDKEIKFVSSFAGELSAAVDAVLAANGNVK